LYAVGGKELEATVGSQEWRLCPKLAYRVSPEGAGLGHL